MRSSTTHQANDRVERLNKRPRALMNNTLKSTRGAAKSCPPGCQRGRWPTLKKKQFNGQRSLLHKAAAGASQHLVRTAAAGDAGGSVRPGYIHRDKQTTGDHRGSRCETSLSVENARGEGEVESQRGGGEERSGEERSGWDMLRCWPRSGRQQTGLTQPKTRAKTNMQVRQQASEGG